MSTSKPVAASLSNGKKPGEAEGSVSFLKKVQQDLGESVGFWTETLFL